MKVQHVLQTGKFAPNIAFLLTRATAINSYAQVEQALASLFAQCLRAKPDYAGVPFFRIHNARARNETLERILKKRYGDKYNSFWTTLMSELAILDQDRNKIVHWAVLPVFNEDNELKSVKLIPPNYWDRDSNTPKMSIEDMRNFIERCVFVRASLKLLARVAARRKLEQPSWRDICLRPISYPIPKDHPLNPTDTEWRPRPESGRERGRRIQHERRLKSQSHKVPQRRKPASSASAALGEAPEQSGNSSK